MRMGDWRIYVASLLGNDGQHGQERDGENEKRQESKCVESDFFN